MLMLVGLLLLLYEYYFMLMLVGAVVVGIFNRILKFNIVAPVIRMREQGSIEVGCVHQLEKILHI